MSSCQGRVKIQTLITFFLSEKKDPVGSTLAGYKDKGAGTMKRFTITRGGVHECQGFPTREALLHLLVVMG